MEDEVEPTSGTRTEARVGAYNKIVILLPLVRVGLVNLSLLSKKGT